MKQAIGKHCKFVHPTSKKLEVGLVIDYANNEYTIQHNLILYKISKKDVIFNIN